MAGGKSADRIVSNHPNVVFLWVAPQPPCHYLKDPLYAMSKRVNPNKAWLFQKEPRNLKSFTAQKGLK